MAQSAEQSAQSILERMRALAGLPPIAGGSGVASLEWTLGKIYEVVANWTPSEGGGGNPGVGATLVMESQEVEITALSDSTHNFRFVNFYNNSFAFEDIAELPEGLGLTIDMTGVDPTIIATEAGTWAVVINMALPEDATLAGFFGIGGADVTDAPLRDMADLKGVQFNNFATVLSLPTGADFRIILAHNNTATDDPYTIDEGDVTVCITRLV